MVEFDTTNLFPTDVDKSVWKLWSDGSSFNDVNANVYPIDFVIGTGEGFIAGYDTGGFKVTTDGATGLTINSGVYYCRTSNTATANDINRHTAVRIYAPDTATLNLHPFDGTTSETGYSFIYLDPNGTVTEATGMEWSNADPQGTGPTVDSTREKVLIAKVIRDGNNTVTQSDIIDERLMPTQISNGGFAIKRGFPQLGKMIIVDPSKSGYTGEAIQDAINQLPSTGGKVYIPEGTWTITSKILCSTDNTTISGAGRSTKLIGDVAGTSLIDVTGDNCVVELLYMENQNASSYCISCTGDHCIIKDNYMVIKTPTAKRGITINGSDYTMISRNYVSIDSSTSNGNICISVDTSLYVIVRGNIIEITNGIATGMRIEDCEYNVISNNIIRADQSSSTSTNYGMMINATSSNKYRNTITGNIIIGFINGGIGDGVCIAIGSAYCNETLIMSNNLSADNPIDDNGTNTFYLTVTNSDPLNN